jgi:hypothetical protein
MRIARLFPTITPALLCSALYGCGTAQDEVSGDLSAGDNPPDSTQIESSAQGICFLKLCTPPPAQYSSRCRTAPPRPAPFTFWRRADVAEAWEDAGPTTSIRTRISDGASFGADQDWSIRAGGFSALIKWASADVDGDDDQDLVAIWNDNGQNTLTVRRSNGIVFLAPQHFAIRQGTWLGNAEWLPGDFNRDGLDDLASVWQDGASTSIAVFLSNGSAFPTYSQWAVRDGTWGNGQKWEVGDFDGDDFDDILAVWNDNGQNTLTVRRSTGTSFTQQHWAIRQGGWIAATEFVVGDYNGDQLSDVAAIWPDGSSTSIAVFPSNGTSFNGHTQWSIRDGGWVGDQGRWSAGDFTGDGKFDLLAAWNDNGMTTLTVRESTGSSFVQQHWATQRTPWNNQLTFCAGTFDAL